VALARIGCGAPATARVGDLSLPVRKQVQLARAFHSAADVLLLDEPTAVLGAEASDKLFLAIRRARDRGAAVVYVSHQIEEVLRIADTVTVLRDGEHVSTDPAETVDAETLVTRMVGRPVASLGRRLAGAGRVLLRLRDLHAPGVRGVTFDVAAGEVVGLAGLVGAGRSELLATIAGLLARTAGVLEVRGPLAFVPEDRARNGLIPTLSLRENIFLPAPKRWLQTRREQVECERWIGRLHVRARGPEALPDSLSGGNQQKVLLARALRRAPKVLLLDEPTAGVDVGAKADIHRIVQEQTAAGAAVVIASSELPELLALCDRIVALRYGRPVATVSGDQATESHLAALITGAERSPAAPRS
jgi:ABC-type sugar transport system ATPase subunit